MSILIDKNTKVICQGLTGKQGTFPAWFTRSSLSSTALRS